MPKFLPVGVRRGLRLLRPIWYREYVFGGRGTMSDRITEVTRTGFGSRILGSFIGVLFGILLVIGSVILLYWNEGRAVQAARALQEGERTVVEASAEQVNNSLDGKLVHVVGQLSTSNGLRDNQFGVGGADVVRLKRNVQMYQWKESEKTETRNEVGGGKVEEKTYTYTKVWSDSPIDSSHFHAGNGHSNPPMPLRNAVMNNASTKLAAYRLDNAILDVMDNFEALQPEGANAPNGYRREGDGFYRGADSANPAIGDLRVNFSAIKTQTMSVLGAQSGNILAPFHADNGYVIKLAAPGVSSATAMLKEAEKSERILTWILRGIGFVVMLIGLMLIAGPISALAMVLPFLGGLVQGAAFVVAFLIAMPLTLFVIAISWIAHRPLLGVILLVVAGVLLFGAIYLRRHRKAASAPA